MNIEKRLSSRKNIALIAHDSRKQDLVEWIKFNKDILKEHNLYATGTTGSLIEKETGLKVEKFLSGPLGGDQQIGARIAEGKIDILIFFWDPLEAQPHDPDVKALIRVATLYNIPIALDRSSADFIISSPLFHKEYTIKRRDYATIRKKLFRKITEGN